MFYFQVVDYAIAKKIVEIHSNMEDTIETLYSQEDILTYISFARQFKPQLTTVSKRNKYFVIKIQIYHII